MITSLQVWRGAMILAAFVFCVVWGLVELGVVSL